MAKDDDKRPFAADLLVPFLVYVVLIVAGLAVAITVGLTHH